MMDAKKVDIVAWIDRQGHVEECPKYWGDHGDCDPCSCGFSEARAALAELIEAMRGLVEVSVIASMMDMLPPSPNANGPLPRAIAILSRLGAPA
jgi:hypothetical protein